MVDGSVGVRGENVHKVGDYLRGRPHFRNKALARGQVADTEGECGQHTDRVRTEKVISRSSTAGTGDATGSTSHVLLSDCSVPGTTLDFEDPAGSKTGKAGPLPIPSGSVRGGTTIGTRRKFRTERWRVLCLPCLPLLFLALKTPIHPLFLFLFCLFAFSRAASPAYGGSQAKGRVGAVATGLHHVTATPDP